MLQVLMRYDMQIRALSAGISPADTWLRRPLVAFGSEEKQSGKRDPKNVAAE